MTIALPRKKYFGWSAILLIFLAVVGGPGRAQEQGPSSMPPNRARWAWVGAPGSRLARFNEIPKSKNLSANLTLSLPQIRPRWIERYAIDGSELTWWSPERSDHRPWIWLALANELRSQVLLSAVKINWSKGRSPRYRVLVKTREECREQSCRVTSEEWSEAEFGLPGESPRMVSDLRIEILEGRADRFAISEIQVQGIDEGVILSAVTGLVAEAQGQDRIRLRWEQAEDGVTYFYRVYRAEGAEPALDDEHLIETMTKKEFVDYGLHPDRTYFYRVAAESFGGRTTPSAAVQVRTKMGQEYFRFPWRGVTEGFYNDPWPHQERLRMMSFLEDAGFNAYIYAPKFEPYHRQLWREPYPESELRNFAELIACAKAHGITFFYGLSPGLDMNFKDPAELTRIKAKFKGLFKVGARAFVLCFDDIPGAGGADRAMGERQARMVNEIYDFLRGLDPSCRLFFVPTVYSHPYSYWKKKKPRSAEYLEALAGVRPEVGIFWTGPGEVFSAKIEKADAEELKKIWGRPVLVWDNYPANDVGLRRNIFTGPYLGRSDDLGEAVGGIFLNPMYLPHASKIALYTAGQYMTRQEYEPWAAYEQGLKYLAGGDDEAYRVLKVISDCLTPHPIFPELSLDRMTISKAVAEFWKARETGAGRAEAELLLRNLFVAYYFDASSFPDVLGDRELAADLLPASQKLGLYGEAGTECIDLLSERDVLRRMFLRKFILSRLAKADKIKWRVADERSSLAYVLIGFPLARRSVFDDFIRRALREDLKTHRDPALRGRSPGKKMQLIWIKEVSR